MAPLVVGSGVAGSVAGFRRLRDGDAIALHAGGQGGQHFVVALRRPAGSARVPLVTIEVRRADTRVRVAYLRMQMLLEPAPEDDRLVGPAARLLVVEDRAYCALLASRVEIETSVTEDGRVVATSVVTVRVEATIAGSASVDPRSWTECCERALPRCTPDAAIDAATDATADVARSSPDVAE